MYLQDSVRDNWDRLALSDFQGESMLYSDVAAHIAKLHILYEKAGIKKGDRIALCGKNSARWAVAFLSVVTFGAVAVPILHDFNSDNIHHLVTHSEARILFCDQEIWERLDAEKFPMLIGVIQIHDFTQLMAVSAPFAEAIKRLNENFGDKYPRSFTREDVVYYQGKPEDLAVINYTSGSMGFSKGVMLSSRAIWSNLQFCIDGLTFLRPGDGVVCMLPMAHMFGLMVDLLHCFTKGCHLHFLTRLPSPAIILKAFAEVKPKLIVSVPLVIEKIIRGKVFPVINKPAMKILLKVPFVKDRILAKIRLQLINAFGGNLLELIIGGAAVSKEVEAFLRKIKFPFTVGYGMTECAPLVAYVPWDKQKPGSCGVVAPRMQARIDSADPEHVPGVLFVKGDNVMDGYYKNPEATASALKEDGWLDTGDICTMDAEGYLFIRGRDKNMILGPSGQNIYPEEIEQVLSNLPLVSECLVVADADGKLKALIYPDLDAAHKQNLTKADIEARMKENIATLNTLIPAYSRVDKMDIREEEFEKTPKRSIKRYLYK